MPPKMPSGRMLRESIVDSKKLAAVTDSAAHLWFKLLVVVDDFGNFLADPAKIKAACYLRKPGTKPSRIKQLRDELLKVGLLTRYEADGEEFIHFERFGDFQVLKYERQRFPRPGGEASATSGSNNGQEVEQTLPAAPLSDSKSSNSDVSPNADNKTGDEVKKKRSKVEGKSEPSTLPSSNQSKDSSPKFEWESWLNNPKPIGPAPASEVQRVVYFHWTFNPKKYWREKIRTEADLFAHFEKMQSECPAFGMENVYYVKPHPALPFGEIVVAGEERKRANGELDGAGV